MACTVIVDYYRVNRMTTRIGSRSLGRRVLVTAPFAALMTTSPGIGAGAFDQPRLRAASAFDQVTNAPAGGRSPDRDVFGIRMLYSTRDGTRPWTSAHWTGREYVITDRLDGHDPQGISGKRGSGTLAVANGVLTMAGLQPRLYIHPYDAAPWRDVELTVYYRRVLDDDTAFAGMVAGVRSGTNGHTTGTPCDAHTYYARMRHDGAFDFAKELKHPAAAARARVPAAQAWPDAQLPRNRWIGFKYVSYNIGDAVKLEVYRDLAEGKDGGQWVRLNEITDGGGWVAATDCPTQHPVAGASDLRVLEGATVLIRNTGVTDARYRWVSLREIRTP
jgi:hypothetical protein